ncbi:hypothetical protein J4410_04820 [Candidatus Woesearchaeota archaeon]|nr:hypothetical protein [Candidatus Woesearchaeota archaeon]
MKEIITHDNSPTFFSEQYQETYHSKSGAVEEARKKFVEPCQIALKSKQKKLVILDICFGLGYNTAVALEVARKGNPSCVIEVFALENDIEILKKILDVNPEIQHYDDIKDIIKEVIEKNLSHDKNKINKKITIENKNIIMHFYLDDARHSIKQIKKECVDAVFLDPFSPKVCPALWTKEFFEDIYQTMKKDAILATYSCARVVRDNLKAAKFRVEDGPCIGRRAPSTIASL